MSYLLYCCLQASCTLEAGVKIYASRVDSVHSKAYKVLGGFNRVSHENDQGILSTTFLSLRSKEIRPRYTDSAPLHLGGIIPQFCVML